MKLDSVEFTTVAGGQQTLLIQHMDENTASEYYNDNAYDQAISGKLRQNFRGYRTMYTFRYDHSVQKNTVKSLLNNIMTDLNNGEDGIFLNIRFGNVNVVPTENLIYAIKYLNQIGKFPPKLEFIDAEPNVSFLGGWVEPGWVDPQWVVQ